MPIFLVSCYDFKVINPTTFVSREDALGRKVFNFFSISFSQKVDISIKRSDNSLRFVSNWDFQVTKRRSFIFVACLFTIQQVRKC